MPVRVFLEAHRNRNAPPYSSLIFTGRHGRFFAGCVTRKRYDPRPFGPSSQENYCIPWVGTASLPSDVQVVSIPNQKLRGGGGVKVCTQNTPYADTVRDTSILERLAVASRVSGMNLGEVNPASLPVLSQTERTLHADELNILYFVIVVQTSSHQSGGWLNVRGVTGPHRLFLCKQ